MRNLVFLVWKNAKVISSEVHGVVVIDELELTEMVRERFEKETGMKADHIELRAIADDPDDVLPHLPRRKIMKIS
ncbi:hypothetical protein ACWO80_003472 [Vibrio cholerae]